MTDIEQKALALVNAEQAKSGCLPIGAYHGPCMKALCRAIEQHESFRQEVSDAVECFLDQWQNSTPSRGLFQCQFSRFIIAQPDPLVGAIDDLWTQDHDKAEYMADNLRKALAARGGRIVWEGE